MSSEPIEKIVHRIERPDPRLLTYYFVTSLILGPLFPILFVPRLFRYRTLRYRFDAEGISMRWGILFRREINLTYARIQDIHLRSGVIERHLDLARIEVQTASGSAKAEMIIEGVLEFEAVRDYLYARMRGVDTAASARVGDSAPASALAETLREITAEIRGLRQDLSRNDRP